MNFKHNSSDFKMKLTIELKKIKINIKLQFWFYRTKLKNVKSQYSLTSYNLSDKEIN